MEAIIYGVLLIVIIGFVVAWILYTVIRNAIDGSETAENIRRIRILLETQYPEVDDISKKNQGDKI